MCLERITDCVPRLVAYCKIMRKMQVNKTECASDCKDILISDITVAGRVHAQALQTTVSAQPIRENGIVNFTPTSLGRALIASNNLCQSACPSTRKLTACQFDLETWPGKGAKRTAEIFIQEYIFQR